MLCQELLHKQGSQVVPAWIQIGTTWLHSQVGTTWLLSFVLGATRTRDLLLRRQPLYPPELREHALEIVNDFVLSLNSKIQQKIKSKIRAKAIAYKYPYFTHKILSFNMKQLKS